MAKKRGRGEGSVWERSDGRWTGYVTCAWQDGKQTKKHFYGKSQKEVLDKIAAARNHQRQGVTLTSSSSSLKDWLEAWLRNCEPPTVKPKTYLAYESIVR